MGELLSKVQLPEDLKKLSDEDLKKLAVELRQYIIDIVAVNHGHLASSLGVVELTIALHHVFNAPYDKIIWDVGHQAYPHKILTGRRDQFHTNRKMGGVSGFPKMSESKFDSFGVGHSSTSISAALGMAEASNLKGENDRQHVAIIGDGAMTAGMAFEALNNAGVSNSNILVILNDNGIAIDPNVGAIHKYLTDISTSKTYNKLKDDVWNLLGKMDKLGTASQKIASKMDTALKAALLKSSNMFESMNFRYFGPVNGHNTNRLIKILNDIKNIPGPKILHVLTTKGKGLTSAELDPVKFHAPGIFDSKTGAFKKEKTIDAIPPKFQDVFGETILELAQDKRVVGITPAMPTGSSFHFMMKKYPERVFDVGIAEQHAVTFAAGLAESGMIPFCNIYSTFMQRAFDQVIHDVALQNIAVVFCLDRAGLVGEDGPTHHGVFDLAYFRSVPNMVIAAPKDEIELRHMMLTAKNYNRGPFSIRYPRGRGCQADWKVEMKEMRIGKGRKLIDGKRIAVLSIGTVGCEVEKAFKKLENDGISPSLYDLRFLKPIDEDLVRDAFSNHQVIISIEDGVIKGGLASEITELASKYQFTGQVKHLGVPDAFIEHGEPDELKSICGFDVNGIIHTIRSFS